LKKGRSPGLAGRRPDLRLAYTTRHPPQPPARSHPIARGRAGPQLLAQVLTAKYGAHLPLNRQSEIYAKEGIDLDVSTLADWVGASAAALMPLVEPIAGPPPSASMPTTPRCRCWPKAGRAPSRLWVSVGDDAPFGVASSRRGSECRGGRGAA